MSAARIGARAVAAAASVAGALTLGCRSSLTVRPTRASVPIGETVQLTARGASGDGVPAEAVTWASSNAAVAMVARSGVVTGAAVGLDTITAARGGDSGSTVVIVTPRSTVWTHEAAGLSGLADNAGDRDYDFTLQDIDGTHPTASGWYDEYVDNYRAGRLSVITDPTAPFPTTVMQMIYPKGYSGGTAPGEVAYLHRTVREYYIGFYFKISNPYQNVSSNHNKIMYIYTTSGRDLVFEFFGPEPYHFGMAEYVSTAAGGEADHYGSEPVTLGKWHKVELSISYGAGTVQWWVDGEPDAAFSAALSSTGGSGLNQTQLSPTYGGGGLPVKPDTDYVWYNHLHMSGSP